MRQVLRRTLLAAAMLVAATAPSVGQKEGRSEPRKTALTQAAPAPEPPLSDFRLSVHTLVREDIFAGVRDEDMDRLARGEKSIEVLLAQRPNDKPVLLVWKAGAILYRAVRAREANHREEFDNKYKQAMDLLSQARQLGPKDVGVAAATAGMYALLADRLPEDLRDQAWKTAYDCYLVLWKEQGRNVERLPLHLRGELLGGLAESAQRTGRAKEMTEYLDKILTVAPDTAYARVAKQWKEDPKTAVGARLTCLSCHAAGRLAARKATLKAADGRLVVTGCGLGLFQLPIGLPLGQAQWRAVSDSRAWSF